MRVDGKFVDSEGNKPPGQGVRPPLLLRVYWFSTTLTMVYPGAALHSSTMLWSHLPADFFERANLGRADAHRKRQLLGSLYRTFLHCHLTSFFAETVHLKALSE